MKEKTLVELAEPLIQDVTRKLFTSASQQTAQNSLQSLTFLFFCPYVPDIYENEWDQAIANEEKLYKQTAMSLGALLDGEMMEAAYGIKYLVLIFFSSQIINF